MSVTGDAVIANRNPIRYRGYFYDTETGLYYCNSRYYDPEVKRFINADAFMSTGQGFLGHNMFAYCQNNPVMFCDPSGNKWVSIRKFVESRGGTVEWYEEDGIAVCDLNNIRLISEVDGDNFHGIGINNENDKLMANDYDLAYYFKVEGWSALMPNFNIYTDVEGFEVAVTKHFLSKSFCIEFAADFLYNVVHRSSYAGWDMTAIAVECYAHAMLYLYSSLTIAIINRGYSARAQAKDIGVRSDEFHYPYFALIWNTMDFLNPQAHKPVYKRAYI